ncbi:MAG TPA: amidohydrolase family protein [Myxococcales bacterium]|nr:amidohydrolase family protein [Myxococcales bacterium]
MIVVVALSLLAQAAATLAPAVKPFVSVDAPKVALVHVRVIDGTGAPARDDQTVLLENGRIAAIGPAQATPPPAGARVIDLRGASVLPGLVGMHDHLFYPAGGALFHEMGRSFPKLYLAAGVTTVRTAGSVEPYTDLELKKLIDAGKSPGPRLHVTGPYLEGADQFTPQMHAIASPADARRTVEFWAEQGATSFKAYNTLTRAQLGAAVEAAHRLKLKVTGHLCSIGFREAAALGIDNLEHGIVVDTEFFSGKKPDACPPSPLVLAELARMDVSAAPIQALIRELVQKRVAVTSTLPVFELFDPRRMPKAVGERVLAAMSTDTRALYLQNQLRPLGPRPDGMAQPDWGRLLQLEMQFERAFVQAGGLLLAGCDPTGNGGVLAGFGDQRELELLVEAGFTPLEAIHIATANGAAFLGEADRIGTLVPGKLADLIVVRGDPSVEIADIEKVETVFKDGVGYDSAKLIESVRGTVGMR